MPAVRGVRPPPLGVGGAGGGRGDHSAWGREIFLLREHTFPFFLFRTFMLKL